jgi:hypothetical protein
MLVACDPLVMIPGGRLSGPVVPPPENWSFTDAIDTVQLETRPADPYSVNVWCIAVDDDLFVIAGSGLETTWAQHIASDDRVRLRVAESIYELRAIPDNGTATREAVLLAVQEKYDFDAEDEDTGQAIVFRLEPR